MNLLNEQLKELNTLITHEVTVQDCIEGLVKISDARKILEDFDLKWWSMCDNQLNNIREGLETQSPFEIFK